MPVVSEKFAVEYTDTFSGEANYAWVNRKTIEFSRENVSQHAIMRKAKQAVGLNGVRGNTERQGCGFVFTPYNHNTILFVNPIIE
jgi:hypothetical protein